MVALPINCTNSKHSVIRRRKGHTPNGGPIPCACYYDYVRPNCGIDCAPKFFPRAASSGNIDHIRAMRDGPRDAPSNTIAVSLVT
ncbi:hypothetical protein GCM10023170_056690 [Phytohabitans houttuyneae]|uniref:Uncharacterized protein n=1 Tax=Phytohabitans houttuyneae TaxID=1076126 RepID=A0A6V8KAZ5_9ACTN|nr:hypothetical protein Phou_047600 [Phytohabitans houttuyneae]